MMIRLYKNYKIILVLAVVVILFSMIKTPPEHLRALDQLDAMNLSKGKQEMASKKLVIVGISRDNAKGLQNVIQNIESTGVQFSDYRVVIFENDSKDGTKDILQEWMQRNPRVNVVSKDFHNKKRPSIQFLADVRNIYLEEIQYNPEYQDFDMVMMLDMDMSYGWDIRGIQDSFARINDWDVVCSNGIDGFDFKMWDIFAFRNEEFPDGPENPDYWTSNLRKMRKRIYSVGDDLVNTYSCFGGMALYKRDIIKECRYSSLNDDCEHVSFHECIRLQNNGKIKLNPNQVIRYSNYFPSPENIAEWFNDVFIHRS